MVILINLKNSVRSFLYKLMSGTGELSEIQTGPAETETPRPHGTTGRLDVPTLLLSENDNVVLIVDHDFGDFPAWVEWDLQQKKLSVVQMGGDSAELALTMPLYHIGTAANMNRLMLVTGRYERRNGHYVSFIVRE